jgi:hypothetical protein
LKKDDVSVHGENVTVEAFEKRTIEGRNGEPDKVKLCVKFHELDKWLVLNATNGDALRKFTDSAAPLDAVGKQVEIYQDESIAFGGKIVGGVRIRPATNIPI